MKQLEKDSDKVEARVSLGLNYECYRRDEFLREKDKEAKKLRQTVEAKKMIDAIFDIANEAYIHQQKQDMDSIDPRNWHEWEQLFIAGLPIVTARASLKEHEEAMNEES